MKDDTKSQQAKTADDEASQEGVAVVDGVKGNVIECTFRLDARGQSLIGRLACIDWDSHLFLGRFISQDMSNPVHQDLTFAPYIMSQGAIAHWSGDADIERGKFEIISVLSLETDNRVAQCGNPPSGWSIVPISQEVIDKFRIEKKYYFNIGEIPNTNGILASIINRHHGGWSNGAGWGEAHHVLVCGQNGSGKTVWLLVLLVGKLAQHPQMGVLIPDLTGDICSLESRHNRGDFQFDWRKLLADAGIKVETIPIDRIRLTSPTTLKIKLRPVLKKWLQSNDDKATVLADHVVESMFDQRVDAKDLTAQNVLEAVRLNLQWAFNKELLKTKYDLVELLQSDLARAERSIEPIRRLFDGNYELEQIVREVLQNARKVILEGTPATTDENQQAILREVMYQLKRQADILFRTATGRQRAAPSGPPCNAIVVLDEGQDWVPEGDRDDGDAGAIAKEIEEAFRKTRKHGIGWMVVCQSPSGLAKKVIRECHTKWFGRGLGIGRDRQHIEDILSKEGAEAYQQLAIQGGYFWVGVGHDANLGTEATYFTVHPFDGDTNAKLVAANPHIFRKVVRNAGSR
jgi:hypothetical protein